MTSLISLVVATRGRHDGVARLLQSLGAGGPDDVSLRRVELVLIEDGPPHLDHVPEWPGPVRHVRHVQCLGMARTRNAGIEMSTASLIGFVDDDGVCAPGWLDAVLASFDDPECHVVGGVIVPADGGSNLFSALRDQVFYPEMFGAGYAPAANGEAASLLPAPYASGGNCAYQRAVFDRFGGFDPELPASIDTDLGARLTLAGVQPLLNRRMVLVHDHSRTLHGYLRRCYVAGRTKGILARRGADRGPVFNAAAAAARGLRFIVAGNVRRAAGVRGHSFLLAWLALTANEVTHLGGIVSGLLWRGAQR